MIDDVRLETLLLRSNQLPASARLLNWAMNCLRRDGHDIEAIGKKLEAFHINDHWPFLRGLLKESDIQSLMNQLAAELNESAKIKLAASGFSFGQQVQYRGNDNLKVKFLKGKILTIKSIQIVDGEIWFTCKVPDSLDLTIPMNSAKKVF